MRSKGTYALPSSLEAVRGRFEQWRRTRECRSRIPDALWAAAVRVAGTCGIHRTAQALRLNPDSLKRHVASAEGARPERVTRESVTPERITREGATSGRVARAGATCEDGARRACDRGGTTGRDVSAAFTNRELPATFTDREAPATFMELVAPGSPYAPECVIELEHPRGAKMRIRLDGRPGVEVVTALSEVFFRSGV